MSKKATKKVEIERRKKPRRTQKAKSQPAAPARASAGEQVASQELCYHCSKDLAQTERALFVEEEVGRIFCSEECITAYFGPEIERLEKEYFRRLSPSDLSASEREGLAHLRWITLQEPDEVWREKTLGGDYRYTLISDFEPGTKKIWSICICLFLRGEPSFLFLAFQTRNAAMVNAYRKGEPVEWQKPAQSAEADGEPVETDENGIPLRRGERAQAAPEAADGGEGQYSDRLADAWTEDETYRAQIGQDRSPTDIPPHEFQLYHACLDETLEEPDEVWSLRVSQDEDAPRLFHFIRHYPDDQPETWYVAIGREVEDEDQIEILDAFPTRDRELVDRYRRGEQEVGEDAESRPATRVVH